MQERFAPLAGDSAELRHLKLEGLWTLRRQAEICEVLPHAARAAQAEGNGLSAELNALTRQHAELQTRLGEIGRAMNRLGLARGGAGSI